MESFYFFSDTDPEDVQKAIEFINKIEEKATIYITSNGGDCYAADVLLDTINENKDKLTLVASGKIMSSAFYIFFSAKCNKRIMEGTVGMYHYSGVSVRLTQSGAFDYEDDEAIIEGMKIEKEINDKWCKDLGMSDKEIKDIKKSKQVFFQYDRLLLLLKK